MNMLEYANKFYKFEKENNLFEAKTKDNIYYWQLKRHDIYYNLYFMLNKKSLKIETQNYKKISIKKIYKFLKNYILDIYYFYKNKNAEHLYFTASRNYINNKYLDIISEDIQKLTKKNFCIETYAFEKKNTYKNISLLIRKKIINKLKKNTSIIKIDNIDLILEKEFNIKTNFNIELQESIQEYRIEYKYYKKKLKKLKKLKKTYIVQNGIQSALFEVLKELKIETIELQHGEVGYLNPSYSYPEKIDIKKLYLPNKFYVFSQFWQDRINYPVSKIEIIGNNYYGTEIINEIEKNEITFISSIVHQKYIEKYLDFLLENKLEKINLKLHPNQHLTKEKIYLKYSKYKNIKIIFTEESLSEILPRSKEIIVVMSTAAFEAMQMQCKIRIIPEADYLGLHDIFHLDGVYLMEKREDILKEIPEDINKNICFFQKLQIQKIID